MAGESHNTAPGPAPAAGLGAGLRGGRRPYDSNLLVAALAGRGIGAVIPPRRKRYPRGYDAVRYAQRRPVERLSSHLKQFRRGAIRQDKLDVHFLAFIH